MEAVFDLCGKRGLVVCQQMRCPLLSAARRQSVLSAQTSRSPVWMKGRLRSPTDLTVSTHASKSRFPISTFFLAIWTLRPPPHYRYPEPGQGHWASSLHLF